MKSWLEKNDIEMYSTNNEGKSIAAIDIKPNTYIYTLVKKLITKILNLKLVLLLENQNI